MSTARLPVSLTDAQILEFGSELDLIRDEVMESRGERDRQIGEGDLGIEGSRISFRDRNNIQSPG